MGRRARHGREAVQQCVGPELIHARLLGLAEAAAYMGEDRGTPAPPDPALLAAALGIDPRDLRREDDDDDY